jgi:GGDEF domain-containing protein
VAERLRAQCRQADPIWIDRVDLSIGVAEFEPEESADAFLQRADAAMYACKAGRPPGAHRIGGHRG